jgi:hypothetical protein
MTVDDLDRVIEKHLVGRHGGARADEPAAGQGSLSGGISGAYSTPSTASTNVALSVSPDRV